jgi:hypothetical protein
LPIDNTVLIHLSFGKHELAAASSPSSSSRGERVSGGMRIRRTAQSL